VSKIINDQPPVVSYSLRDGATALGVGLTTFSGPVRSGQVKSFRQGKRVLILKCHLVEYCESLYAKQHGGGN
jgi:hypothetical protein